jgi:UPF0716 family protein affecting phage T7 exclusion
MNTSNTPYRPGWLAITSAVVGLTILYIAGFGPLARLAQDGVVGEGTVHIVYAPLLWIIAKAPAWLSALLLLYLVL